MKKFFAEFKKFITRGNVIDMAVGVIVGGAFTAIVNGVTNNVLKPIVNFVLALIFGDGAFESAYTFLGPKVYTTDAEGNAIIFPAGGMTMESLGRGRVWFIREQSRQNALKKMDLYLTENKK